MNIFITGVGGFIGSAVARCMHSAGHAVSGSSHDINHVARDIKALLVHGVPIDFDQSVQYDVFEGQDAIIHCAYDNKAPYDKNINGVLNVFNEAEKAKVPYQLLISSHSARPNAISEYGKIKYKLESYFLAKGQAIVRPGLVIGNGGFFLRQMQLVGKLPAIALPSANRAPVFYIGIVDLLQCIQEIVQHGLTGPFNLFSAHSVSMKFFIKTIKDIPVLSVPVGPLFSLARRYTKKSKKLPAWLGRIETLRQNMEEPIHQSDLASFLSSPQTLEQAIALTRTATRPNKP